MERTMKTKLAFTFEELQLIKEALNDYSLDAMNKSTTWGNVAMWPKQDFFHKKATAIGLLWIRFYDALQKYEPVEESEEANHPCR